MSFINSYITVLNWLKQYTELVFTVKVWVIHLLSDTAVNIRLSYINMIYTFVFGFLYLFNIFC